MLNVIDVHELAGELGVSAEVIRQTAAELAGTAVSGRELPRELAEQVRNRLRSPNKGYSGAAGSPMFSAGNARSTAAPLGNRVVAPAFAVGASAPRGPQQPPAQQTSVQPRPVQQTYVQQPAARPSVSDGDTAAAGTAAAGITPASLGDQLAAQTALDTEAEQWRVAGLGAHDTHLIEQCRRHGLTPEDLRRRVDGRTVASRLKNGESFSSVRSRLT